VCKGGAARNNRRDEKGSRDFQRAAVSSDTEAMAALVTDSERKTPARLAGSAILALQSDERLVRLFRSGHERAFDAIVERYRKPLVRFSAGILPESRTEDAVQQAFINAHTALLSSDEPVQLRPWLYTITRNASLNMLRQNGWNYEQIPLDFDGVRRPDQVFEQRIELQETVAAMNALPARQRDALVMRELEGRSYDEIAATLGANDGAVRQLLNRARVTLRSAASAVVPAPLVARAAASMPPSDGRRLAEILGGVGAAGIAKAGATALVAGSLVVGAVNAPLPMVSKDKTTRERATLSQPKAAKAAAAHDTPIAAQISTAAHAPRAGRTPAASRHESRHSSGNHSGSRHSGSGEDRSGSRSGDDHASSNDLREHSGTTNSGSDDSRTRTRSGADNRSGSSGRSGSDDRVATVTQPETTTTTSGSNSGEGSTSSGSGSGGSGSDDGVVTTTTTTTAPTESSGSGSSHSGLDD
jgi:RNA polymerase sigma factor (sigma-70 family)